MQDIEQQLQRLVDHKTKPVGALGQLEALACQERADDIDTELAAGGCNIPIPQCTGYGAGLDDAQLTRNIELLQQAQARYPDVHTAEQILQRFGGYEIAMIAGRMLSAHRHNMIIMVDGFIATAACLAAVRIKPEVADNAIFCYLSDERGHIRALEFIGAALLLRLCLRLGEGTGRPLAYSLIRCAVGFMNEMASFDSANISNQK